MLSSERTVRGVNIVSPALLKEAAGEVFGKNRGKKLTGDHLWQWFLVGVLSLILGAGVYFLVLLTRQSSSVNTAEIQDILTPVKPAGIESEK